MCQLGSCWRCCFRLVVAGWRKKSNSLLFHRAGGQAQGKCELNWAARVIQNETKRSLRQTEPSERADEDCSLFCLCVSRLIRDRGRGTTFNLCSRAARLDQIRLFSFPPSRSHENNNNSTSNKSGLVRPHCSVGQTADHERASKARLCQPAADIVFMAATNCPVAHETGIMANVLRRTPAALIISGRKFANGPSRARALVCMSRRQSRRRLAIVRQLG